MALFPLSALNEIGLESPSCLCAHLLGFSKGAQTLERNIEDSRTETGKDTERERECWTNIYPAADFMTHNK